MMTSLQLAEMAHQCRVKGRDRMTVDLAIAIQEYLASPQPITPPTATTFSTPPINGCPECARRKAQTAARVAKCKRKKAK